MKEHILTTTKPPQNAGLKGSPKPANDRLLRVKEVCTWLQVSRTTVWKLRREGVLPTVYLRGRMVRFRQKDVEALLTPPN